MSGKCWTPDILNIVSLLPSATEIVCALGCGDRLKGVTHECDYPPGVERLPRVTRPLIDPAQPGHEIDKLVHERLQSDGALYTLDIDVLRELEPGVILTQALCDVCAVSEADVCRAAELLPGNPVVINLEPRTLTGVLQTIRQVAGALEVDCSAYVNSLQKRIAAVDKRSQATGGRPRVALLEWLSPPFSTGHWGPEMVRLAGGVEGLGSEGRPSTAISWHDVLEWQPEVMVIACCGWDIERTRAELAAMDEIPGWNDLPAVMNGRAYLSDGAQYFSRPGPRLVDSLEILAHAIHPDVHPRPDLPGARFLEYA